MNTILLVDDDEYVIGGLLKHIPWADMGVRIVGTASDGIVGPITWRALGPRSLCDAFGVQYSRERLFRVLPVLLWEEPLNDLKLKRRLQKLLRTSASDWQSLVVAYKKVWPRFS